MSSSSSSSAYMNPDAKKEEFRKYLEKSGVIDSVTKALVGLYEEPERPAQAVDFMRRSLGSGLGVDIDAIRAENESLKAQVASLQQQLDAAKKTISAFMGK